MRRMMMGLALVLGITGSLAAPLSTPARAFEVLGPVTISFSSGMAMNLFVDSTDFVYGTVYYGSGFNNAVAGRYLPGIGINLSLGDSFTSNAHSVYLSGNGLAQTVIVASSAGNPRGIPTLGNLMTWSVLAARSEREDNPSAGRIPPEMLREALGLPPTPN